MAEDNKKKTEAYLIVEAESRNCPVCSGAGMATVYAPGYDGAPFLRDRDGRPYVARTMAHCQCPLGRYLRASSPEDVVRRTPDVTMINEGYSTWSLVDPTEEVPDDHRHPATQADFDEFWRMVESRKMLKDATDLVPPKQSAWSQQTAMRDRLAREIGLDEGVAEIFTIGELLSLKKAKGMVTL
jgi:hypothetical protein